MSEKVEFKAGQVIRLLKDFQSVVCCMRVSFDSCLDVTLDMSLRRTRSFDFGYHRPSLASGPVVTLASDRESSSGLRAQQGRLRPSFARALHHESIIAHVCCTKRERPTSATRGCWLFLALEEEKRSEGTMRSLKRRNFWWPAKSIFSRGSGAESPAVSLRQSTVWASKKITFDPTKINPSVWLQLWFENSIKMNVNVCWNECTNYIILVRWDIDGKYCTRFRSFIQPLTMALTGLSFMRWVLKGLECHTARLLLRDAWSRYSGRIRRQDMPLPILLLLVGP